MQAIRDNIGCPIGFVEEDGYNIKRLKVYGSNMMYLGYTDYLGTYDEIGTRILNFAAPMVLIERSMS